MISTSQDKRRLVPQWRRFISTTSSSELAMPARREDVAAQRRFERDFVKRMERFRDSQDLISAADLVESAVVLGHDMEGVRAARVVLRDRNTVPLVRIQAERLMRRTGNGEEFQLGSSELASIEPVAWRERTRLNPADAIAWVELALAQFSRGHVDHAKRSMTIALQLAPGNRHILRSATRLFFHLEDFERAHDLLRRNESTRGDPWLMAAEVALSGLAERRSAFMKQGLVLIESNILVPSQITELAGALGTQVLLDGGGRLGRKLMRQSQMAPTVNAIAQAEWVSLNFHNDVNVEQPTFEIAQKAWEAMSLRAFYVDGDLQKAFDYAEHWIEDEPYNPVAYVSAGVAANVMERFEIARKICKKGLEVTCGSDPILNTMAFASACVGDLQDAESYLSKVRDVEGDQQSLVAAANRGLIAMRRGQGAQGKSLYRDAIAGFKRYGFRELEAGAFLYFASELARSGEPKEGRKRVEEARKLNEVLKRNYLDFIARRVEDQLDLSERGDASEPGSTGV